MKGTAELAAGSILYARGAENHKNQKGRVNENQGPKSDRIKGKPGERAQNQLDGIQNAQDKAKKAVQGDKQNKINNVDKSKQRLDKELRDIKNLDDAKDAF